MFNRKADGNDLFLEMPLELEEGPPTAAYTRVLRILSVAAVTFLAWAAIGQVREVASATGEIVPAGKIQTVGHLEGGIVAEVLVQEGELVEKGQPLLRLQETATSNDLEKVQNRLQFLEREEQRLTGDGSANNIRLDELRFSEAQQAAFDAQQEALEQEQQALQARISEREAELNSVIDQIGRAHV